MLSDRYELRLLNSRFACRQLAGPQADPYVDLIPPCRLPARGEWRRVPDSSIS